MSYARCLNCGCYGGVPRRHRLQVGDSTAESSFLLIFFFAAWLFGFRVEYHVFYFGHWGREGLPHVVPIRLGSHDGRTNSSICHPDLTVSYLPTLFKTSAFSFHKVFSPTPGLSGLNLSPNLNQSPHTYPERRKDNL